MLAHLEWLGLSLTLGGNPKTLSFDSDEALYNYARSFDYVDKYGKRRNRFLEATMCSENESLRHEQHFNDSRYRYRWRSPPRADNCFYLGYLTRSVEGRVIDLRNYEQDLYAFDAESYADALRAAKREQWDAWQAARNAKWEKARKLCEGKPYWGYYRRIRTFQEMRYTADPEHKPYIRGKRSRSSLPDAWDDFRVRRQKSWKARDKKAARQWAASLLKHIDTVEMSPP